MDCSAICLLTTAVQFLPLLSTTNCTYCVEARSTYEHCFKDVIDCAYRDPSSLILCLNVFEKNGGDPAIIQHTIRCVSYQDYYVEDEVIRRISSGGSCVFEHVQKCECDVCKSSLTTTKTTSKPPTEITPIHRIKHHHHHHISNRHKHEHLAFPNNSFAQQYKDSGYYLASLSHSNFQVIVPIIFLVYFVLPDILGTYTH